MDTYVECLVARKPSGLLTFLKNLLVVVVVICLLLSSAIWILLLVGLAALVGVYFAGQYAKTEYEYLYVDKEITVDKIMNKSRRKRVEKFEVDHIEMFAPINSWHLDSIKNRELKITDFSSGVEEKPDKRYVMIYRGNRKVIFEPSREFVQALRNVAPRKVFFD